ncbi:MAG TPA: efflux RND transporter permease subunit [Gemmataceae bacterium]|nr:efflux RND transporter permease subunit [Gemmataceae bacterium]
MISRFFINRPIFAAVLSIVITLAGGISLFTLPLAQFPSVTPPTVQVACNYPGASAKEVADSVAAPIEQQVNGVEGIMYMSSQCANDGSYNLTVTFYPGINLNVAQVLVQNRVNLAVPQLPDVIKATGVTTIKRSPDILMGLAINSPDGTYDQLYLSNFALMQIKDELARVQGVGDVFLFGQRDYSMRIWVDPAKLSARSLSASDVLAAVAEQNQQVATGAIGQEPISGRQESQVTLSTLGRLTEVEQFENIVVKTGRDRRLTRIKDVGRVELGAKNQDISVRLDGQPTVFLAIFQMPDANALDVYDRVLAKMEELKKSFPNGVDYTIGFDTTPYTRESILEVVKTLRDAIALVAVVVLLFLQNWRSAIIPLVAVPVAIIGTFAAMAAIGFSLNNLTLFGLVLAIGIVVDDAIVVVEAVEHHIENGLSPRQATLVAMKQVSGPVIAVGLVLSAVFVPCAFISGITGQFFRQFALTIAVSTIISTFNSLTLSPALTALLLRPREQAIGAPLPRLAFLLAGAWLGWVWLTPWLVRAVEWLPASAPGEWIHKAPWMTTVAAACAGGLLGWLAAGPLNYLLGRFFRGFNAAFRGATNGYVRLVGGVLRVSVVALLIYGGLILLTYKEFKGTRRGFIPSQDMGYLMVNVQLPDSASTERTSQIMKRIDHITRFLDEGELDERPGIWHATVMSGQSFVLNAAGSNFGSMFINLKPYHERRDPSLSSDVIANELRQEFAKIEGAIINVFGPPPVRGVGRSGGFTIMIEDRGDLGPKALQEQIENLCRKANMPDPQKTPWLAGPDGGPRLLGLFSVFRANVPQLHIDPNAGACMMRGVSMQKFAETLQAYEGSLYINDFNRFGRTWQVIVQAEPEYRQQPESLAQLKIRNSRGAMVPVGSLANQRESNGPLILTRYNMYPAASVNGGSAPGVSSGDTINLLERLARAELPQAMSFEWTDMSYLELLAGNTAMIIFAFAVVMVFLVLAAQYESWSLPLAVILVVPMCLLSAITGVNIANQDINIFTQIGFVVLVGLASKNAILIVEFAKLQRQEGKSRREATLEACKLRLRPIVMTSFAFILGVLPLLISHGAGAEMRRTLGTAVFSGMVGVTLFGIVLTPVFFYTIDWLGESRLFQARFVRRAGQVALDVLTIGVLRLAAAISRRPAPVQPKIPAVVHTNGAGKHPAGSHRESIQQK